MASPRPSLEEIFAKKMPEFTACMNEKEALEKELAPLLSQIKELNGLPGDAETRRTQLCAEAQALNEKLFAIRIKILSF